MRIVTVEEHFVSPGFLSSISGERYQAQLVKSGPRGAELLEKLRDVGNQRIAEMDAAGIDVQILSLTSPGLEQSGGAEAIALATETNDFVLAAVNQHPTRFAALAALPTTSPNEAADELTFRVTRQGFKGAIINGHTQGRYLDDRFFWPILERAESLAVPIYLHPTLPSAPVVEALYSGFTPGVNFLFAGPAWGWHIETATHALRMILGGVFDRFPKLQVVVGHMGEGLAFMLPRIDSTLPTAVTKLERSVGEYLRENFHYTFAGFNFPAMFLNLLLEVGIDRVMFSVDYPYVPMAECRAFLDSIPVAGTSKRLIANGNADKLFRL